MALISTVDGIRGEIGRRLNQVSADHLDKYLTWINLGLQDLGNQFPEAPWLETSAVLTLAASTRTWQVSSIASDVIYINDIRISAQNMRPIYVTREVMDTLDPQPDDSGIPRVYTVYNDEITFYPTPDSNYGAQVNYSKTAATVSASSATTEIPQRWLEALVHYSVVQGLYEREDYDLASVFEAKYRKMVDAMKQEMKRKSLESRRIIDVRELQGNQRLYNNEIAQMFYGS